MSQTNRICEGLGSRKNAIRVCMHGNSEHSTYVTNAIWLTTPINNKMFAPCI